MPTLDLSGDQHACDAIRRWFVAGAPAAIPPLRWHVHVGDDWNAAHLHDEHACVDDAHGYTVQRRRDGSTRLHEPTGVQVDIAALDAAVTWRIKPRIASNVAAMLPTVGMLTLIFALRRVGWHHLHGATLEAPDGNGWLLIGTSGSGKSTTAALLSKAGWRLGGDDALFLAHRGSAIVAHPWRAPIGLRSDVVEMFGFEAAATATVAEEKRRTTLQSLGGHATALIEPRALALLSLSDRHSSRTVARQSEAMAALLGQGAWIAMEHQFADPYLKVLEGLVRQSSSVNIRIGRDLGADAPRLFSPVL